MPDTETDEISTLHHDVGPPSPSTDGAGRGASAGLLSPPAIALILGPVENQDQDQDQDQGDEVEAAKSGLKVSTFQLI